ncbi:hypothetical protein DFJ74DRAFT_726192 [Hyaloraphidium curvatum]|nr:hypothetical protein DFJ74DRAFT_726192 [Hyaloraphidium curvatum]
MVGVRHLAAGAVGAALVLGAALRSGAPGRGARLPAAAGPRADFVPGAGRRAHAALCLAVKDQPADVLEWVAWHHHLARVDRLYVVENVNDWPPERHAAPPTRTERLLAGYIGAGVVEHLPFVFSEATRGRYPHHQAFAYSACFDLFGLRHEWIVAIDADEFVEYPGIGNGTSLSDILRAHERPGVGELLLNWRMFGNPNGTVRTRPLAGTVATYTGCMPASYGDNRHHKTAARPRALRALNIHAGELREGWRAVDERGVALPVTDLRNGTATVARVWVNHYVSRSAEENAEKTARGSGDLNTKTAKFFKLMDRDATETCASARDAWLASGVWDGAAEWAEGIGNGALPVAFPSPPRAPMPAADCAPALPLSFFLPSAGGPPPVPGHCYWTSPAFLETVAPHLARAPLPFPLPGFPAQVRRNSSSSGSETLVAGVPEHPSERFDSDADGDFELDDPADFAGLAGATQSPDPEGSTAIGDEPSGSSSSDEAEGKTDACRECGRAFKSTGHLNRHKRSHLPESLRPHACSFGCGRRFARTDNLRMHEATHRQGGHRRKRTRRARVDD